MTYSKEMASGKLFSNYLTDTFKPGSDVLKNFFKLVIFFQSSDF